MIGPMIWTFERIFPVSFCTEAEYVAVSEATREITFIDKWKEYNRIHFVRKSNMWRYQKLQKKIIFIAQTLECIGIELILLLLKWIMLERFLCMNILRQVEVSSFNFYHYSNFFMCCVSYRGRSV
jgi:hypothetical protein